MKIRSASLLAAVALAGLAVTAYAQGVFDPGPPPPLPGAAPDAGEEADEVYADDEPGSEEQPSEPGEIVYESYEVVQPIPDEPGPAARTIEPPEAVAEEQAEAPAPVRRGKLVKIERVAQATAPDKRVRIDN